MTTTDFIVHINETLDTSTLESVEDDIRHGKGVIAAGHRVDKPHMMQVVYDSDATRMAEIVDEVKHHGLHAQAVGL
jgi:hypothetical protein